MYSVLSVTTNIGGFKKTTYPEAGLITYDGNNYSIRIKTVGDNSYIEFLDNDQSTFDAQLTQEERLQKIIDFTNLSDKRGQLTAEAYVEDIISTDATPQTTPVTGGGTGGGDVTVIDNQTDFSTEATLAAILDKTARYNKAYAIPYTLSLNVDDWQASDGGLNDNPYPLIAIRKKDSISNAAFIGFITAVNEQNDDFRINIYRFDRNQIQVRTGEAVTWESLDNNLEGYEFPRTGIGQFIPTSSDLRIGSFQSRDFNNRDINFDKQMEGDNYEYLVTWKGHSDGSDSFVSVNPYSFTYQ